jgi:antitoxin YefM
MRLIFTIKIVLAYLLRSPRNARKLLESIAELESGRGTERGLIE